MVDKFKDLLMSRTGTAGTIRHRVSPTGSKKIQLTDDNGQVAQASPTTITKYQEIIGSLLYAATHTRIDIAYATGVLARYSSNPQPHHMDAAIRVLEYLNTHPDKALVFRGDVKSDNHLSMTVQAYSDADWAGCVDTRRSTTGTIIMLNGNVVHWASTKQHTVATSSTEAEYMALSDTAKLIKWYNSWLNEVLLVVPDQFQLLQPNPINVDNQAAIALTASSAPHNRTKHIDVRYHFVKEQVATGALKMVWTPSAQQLADLLTKQLPKATFAELVSKLMVSLSTVIDR